MGVYEDVQADPTPGFFTEAGRLLLRSMWAVVAVCIAFGLVAHQARVVPQGPLMHHPLLAALDAVDATVVETHIVVRAFAPINELPTFTSMKEVATYLVRKTVDDVSPPTFWSEIIGDDRVVYYRGAEPRGGYWLASAGALHEGWPLEVVSTASLHRVIYGRFNDVKNELDRAKWYVRSAAGAGSELDARLVMTARPSPTLTGIALAEAILQHVQADPRVTVRHATDEIVIGGYTSLLPGRASFHGQDVNVVVHVMPHGQGYRVDVGHPRL